MLKEEETLQKGSVDESDEGTNLGEHSASLEDKNNGLGPQIETGLLQVLQPSENIDLLQQENIKLQADSQAAVREGKKLAGEIEDSQKVISLEKKKQVLQTEFPAFLQNNDGSEKMASNMENTGTKGGSELNVYSKKCTSAEQQVQYALLSRQNKTSLQKECSSSSEHNNLQEGNCMLRSYVSAMQEQTKNLAGKTHNLLMEEENARNQLSRQSSSMQEQEHKAELIQALKNQVEDLELALQESQYENARLTNKYGRQVEENDIANTRLKTLEAELACTQKENQKLRKELSAKVTGFRNLQTMFYSLAKEKEVMATELALKVRILADMEEHLSDLKERDKTLSNKLQAYERELKSKTRTMQGTITLLQNRDKLLTEQLLKSSEGCRTLKRKLKELQEYNRGLKREIGNLKSSIQKQDKSIDVLQSERTALQNDLTSGKKQLHTLQEKFKCFIEEINSDKKRINYMDRQESLEGEIVLLEQLLLHVKEQITCFKAETDRRDKERQKLKEEIAQLQTEMSYLRAENNALRNGGPSDEIEKKLNADNLNSDSNTV